MEVVLKEKKGGGREGIRHILRVKGEEKNTSSQPPP
jgi:hypothetical protein